ncbi:F-box protein [Medicago truncatula]|uniref:F-box protein n=1 Tax=Medicago truncatula TaxID=3880 RepID=G7K9Y8_MEDTR|nr:F-box protein [Medicago truncatula]
MMKRQRHNHNPNPNPNQDRLSDLSDCLLLHILSFLDTKHAVQTCILSPRWNNLWKHLSSLKLSSIHFPKNLKGFTKFVSHVLSLRNDTTSLLALDFHRSGTMDPRLLKRILKYAFSHNVQQLQVDVKCVNPQFSPSFFSCHTLTTLKLKIDYYSHQNLFPTSLNLPQITNLSLHRFIFCVGDDGRVNPFSTLNKLNTLVITGCIVRDYLNLCIVNATLANLRIQSGFSMSEMKFQLSTPNLCTFVYRGYDPLQKLCESNINLSSIEHVNLNVEMWVTYIESPLFLLNWLVELGNMKSLSVTSRTLKVLSLVPNLLKVEFPTLYNLKSLKVEMGGSSIPKGLVEFLLQNAPSAKLMGFAEKSGWMILSSER